MTGPTSLTRDKCSHRRPPPRGCMRPTWPRPSRPTNKISSWASRLVRQRKSSSTIKAWVSAKDSAMVPPSPLTRTPQASLCLTLPGPRSASSLSRGQPHTCLLRALLTTRPCSDLFVRVSSPAQVGGRPGCLFGASLSGVE